MDNQIALLLIAVGALFVFRSIANDAKLSPTVRFIARTVDGDIYQDLISGEFFFG
jgi:hypothetical protein